MKAFRLVLLIFGLHAALLAAAFARPASTPHPTPAASLLPLSPERRQELQAQRDTLLKQLNDKLADAVHQAAVLNAQHASDAQAQESLAEKTQMMANTIEGQEAKITALEKSVRFWKRIVAIEAALVAVFLCLWLKVPELSPPYGLGATIAAGPLVFGLFMLF